MQNSAKLTMDAMSLVIPCWLSHCSAYPIMAGFVVCCVQLQGTIADHRKSNNKFLETKTDPDHKKFTIFLFEGCHFQKFRHNLSAILLILITDKLAPKNRDLVGRDTYVWFILSEGLR